MRSNRGAGPMLAMLVAAVVVLGGCGGTDAPSAGTLTAQATDVASGIGLVGGTKATLGTVDGTSALLRLTMSIKGISQADIDCYLPIAVPAFGTGFATLTVTDVAIWLSDTDGRLPIPARESAEKCFGPDSTARLKAHQISPDLDIPAARTVLRSATILEARAVGLTASQAECYAAQTFDGLTDAQVKAGIAGSGDPKIRHPASSVRACLSASRIRSLAPKLVKQIAAVNAAAQAQHERTQASIDAELRAGQASTTTTP